MTDVLLILDGATDPEPATLREAVTPALDALATGGIRWRTLLDDGIPVGSENAIASLLGWRPTAAVDRAMVEAAARGLSGPVRRVDLRDYGHKLLVFGDTEVTGPGEIRVWPRGVTPPRILGRGTVVIGALGAATGLGALMGARTVVPTGATGKPGSNLVAKREAALAALADRALTRLVVHVGCADEAGHLQDRALKVAELERTDRELVGPLADAVRAAGGSFTVCADHGCDPATGRHIGGPVPFVGFNGTSESTFGRSGAQKCSRSATARRSFA